MSNAVAEERELENLIHRMYRLYVNSTNIVERAEWEEKLKKIFELHEKRNAIHTKVCEKKSILNDLKNAVLVSVATGCFANRKITQFKGKPQTLLLEVREAR